LVIRVASFQLPQEGVRSYRWNRGSIEGIRAKNLGPAGETFVVGASKLKKEAEERSPGAGEWRSFGDLEG